MKKKIILAISIATMFMASSCSQEKQKTEEKVVLEGAITTTADKDSEGYKLMKTNCLACHGGSTSQETLIAPPMVAVKKHYKMKTSSRAAFIKSVVAWGLDPKAENTKMKGAVDRFKVMPKLAVSEKDLTKIATYIYDNKLDKPAWFDAHFKEMHGKGKGKGKMKGKHGMHKNH